MRGMGYKNLRVNISDELIYANVKINNHKDISLLIHIYYVQT